MKHMFHAELSHDHLQECKDFSAKCTEQHLLTENMESIKECMLLNRVCVNPKGETHHTLSCLMG